MKKESLFAAIDQRQAEILSWGTPFLTVRNWVFRK